MNHPSLFARMVDIERRKLFGRALLWTELVLFGALVAILHLVILYVSRNHSGQMPTEMAQRLTQALHWPQALINALQLANGGGLGGMLVVVLVGAFVAQEYRWRTVQLWLSRGAARPHFLLAKSMVILIALALIALTPLLVGGVITGVFTYLDQGTLPWLTMPWGTIFFDLLKVAYTLMPYAALTFFLAVASRSTMVAIGVGLGYSLLLENIFIQLLSAVSQGAARIAGYFPAMLAQSIMQTLNADAELSVDVGVSAQAHLLAPSLAALLIGLYTVILLAATLWIFLRQDISG